MANICSQCGSALSPQQTFCRQCGTLTGSAGSDPTMVLCRPGPDAASPWAQVGTRGDNVTMPEGVRPTGSGTLLPLGQATRPSASNAMPNSTSARLHAHQGDTEPSFEKTRIVGRDAGPKVLRGWLVALAGNEAGKDWRVQPGKNAIGRGPGADIALADDSVSMQHAVLWVDQEGGVTLVDRDSSNGTFVNRQQIFEPKQIEANALIRFGENSVLQWVPFKAASN